MPTPDLSRAVWRGSLRSQQNGACVEITALDVPVTDAPAAQASA